MGNRFTRNIQKVKNIGQLPLNTNNQNDLISDVKGNVYVRNNKKYTRITGIEEIESKIKELEKQIKELK